MLKMLVAVYRANPFRPHCSDTRHVLLCRVLGFSGTEWCPAKDA